jgi:hypothetical protein
VIPATTSVSTDALSSKLDELDTIYFFVVNPILFSQTDRREREKISLLTSLGFNLARE